ncbi:hypothetical protein [Puia dinghuensis]|uniref:GLPGLI family protein n=1 Tax=Puia dinghuensis TaxID=1792502 RepID=A0A8J2UCR8_9BACT|nr:hypothetical protein [Puia dinghuensis]GGA99246.1 hypothetical protein GCM10011511_23200 [Puia dinghuensis]
MKATLTLLILACCFTIRAQQSTIPDNEHARLLIGKKRCLIAYAGNDHSFTLETPLHSAKPSDVPGFITIDKQIVQATVVPGDKNIDLTGMTPAREKDVLQKYMNYELDYYRKKLKQHYSHLQTEWLTLSGKLFLVWYFDMPPTYKLVSRQVYVSTLFGNEVMDLNAPVFKTDDWGKARGILVRLAGTMKTFNKRLDLDDLGKKLNKG